MLSGKHAHILCGHSSSILSIYSGHILTRRELEGLSALLDLYSKETIDKIRLEIYGKQGEDISREEVERLLQQHGLQQVADDFEGSIEKGMQKIIELGSA